MRLIHIVKIHAIQDPSKKTYEKNQKRHYHVGVSIPRIVACLNLKMPFARSKPESLASFPYAGSRSSL